MLKIVKTTIAVSVTASLLLSCDRLMDTNSLPNYGSADLEDLVQSIHWTENYVRRKAKVALVNKPNIEDTLPDIDQYQLVVNPTIGRKDVAVEIFVTTTRSGKGADGRMVDIASAFNRRNIKLADGRTAKVKIRKIASGTGYQYIANRRYLPDAFSPVHHLWINMAISKGIPMTAIRESMVVSVGGVVMKDEIATRIESKYGQLNIRTITDNVVQGNMAMGYTNPYHSSTGLNFLTTILYEFSNKQEKNMFSPSVVSTFENFQQGIPFVALTTLHMRDAVLDSGSLDAFIMGHQTFRKSPELQRGYRYIPFGVLHDHPLYAVGKISEEKLQVLELLARFAEADEFSQLTLDYGWNQTISKTYQSDIIPPSGETLLKAQQLWKAKKDAGKPIIAMFLCDTSGSMDGSRIRNVKEALIKGSEFISPQNSIGLMTFSQSVNVLLAINKFDLNQRSAFVAGVEDLQVGGSTAMYNGVALALSLLEKEHQKDNNSTPMLFVLTDGESNAGIEYKEIHHAVQTTGIPIYTIGYEANIGELKKLSSLVEAVSISAVEDNVQYKIGSLLNAQM